MSNLKEVRTRISSIISTQQITSAMKLVSASKLKKAQDTILRLRPYSAKLNNLLEDIEQMFETDIQNSIPYAEQRPINKVLFVVITSNRGLCGAFNANVIKKVLSLIETNYAEQEKAGNIHILSIGKKSTEFFNKKKYKIISSHNELYDNLTFDNVSTVAEKIMDYFIKKQYDKIEIVYNQFKNAAVQVLTHEQFLPITLGTPKVKGQSKTIDYILEPNKTVILQEIVPKIIKIMFYRAILESNAAEHGARMTAMHKATDNATEILKELRLSYNKARQATITGEILEIVAGAEALKG
jgi:F-type H+-transporting ATPase subunit gamma